MHESPSFPVLAPPKRGSAAQMQPNIEADLRVQKARGVHAVVGAGGKGFEGVWPPLVLFHETTALVL
eukprot:2952971-Rhodomonas_salina.1